MSKIRATDLNLYYGNFYALKYVNLAVEEKRITSIIGPSGCGKSTLLRVFNRINDTIEGIKITGEVLLDNNNIYADEYDVDLLRQKVGMVFQRPNAFPLSIFENVAFGLKIHRMAKDVNLGNIIEESLRAVLLWDEVKDKLRRSALELSLEQRQRLCIARLIAVKPDVILLDEPCSALDPIATRKIEELMIELKNKYTIIIVTHNMQQAARISDDTGFMLMGELVEFGKTSEIFTTPENKKTEDYVTGRFG